MCRECRERFSHTSDPYMHHGTCLTHVPWCMSGSLTRAFLWSRRRGTRSRHTRSMRNPHLYVSGKRPIGVTTDYIGPNPGNLLLLNGDNANYLLSTINQIKKPLTIVIKIRLIYPVQMHVYQNLWKVQSILDSYSVFDEWNLFFMCKKYVVNCQCRQNRVL